MKRSMRSTSTAHRYATNSLILGPGSGHPHAEQRKSQLCGLNSQTDFTRNFMLVLLGALKQEAVLLLHPHLAMRSDALIPASGCGQA